MRIAESQLRRIIRQKVVEAWRPSEFYIIIDNVSSDVLSQFDFRNDEMWEWDEWDGYTIEFIAPSARFATLPEANKALRIIQAAFSEGGAPTPMNDFSVQKITRPVRMSR